MKKPKQIIFELTNRCKLRCKMCDIWREFPKTDFSKQLFSHLLNSESMDNVNQISFTGGEPFAMNDLFVYYGLARKYFPKSYINISSNGYQTDSVMNFVESVGQDQLSITISYDGIYSHDIIRGSADSRKMLLRTVSQLDKRIPVQLKFTITPWNYTEITDTARHAEKLGLPIQIKMIEELKCYHNRQAPLNFEFNPTARQHIVNQAEDALRIKNVVNRRYIKDMILKLKIKHFSCNYDKKTIFIGLYGDVYSCRRKHALGNLNEKAISEILSRNNPLLSQVTSCKELSCYTYSPK